MAKRFSVLLSLMLLVSCITTAADSGTLPPVPLPGEMVLIPAGSFLMGDAFGEGYSEELPVQTVGVSAFYMDTYEVTKGLWDEVATWAEAHGYDINAASGSGKASDHPVCHVSWYEAVKWANARSEKEGLTPCYTVSGSVYRAGDSDNVSCNWSAGGYRLPTEAEWERAARGEAAGRRYPWADSDEIDTSRANYNEAYGGTTPVGSFPANGYGLYDMAGNVWEWCGDWYSKTYYASSLGTDPRGSAAGSKRVSRGGSWYGVADYCRVAYRDRLWPGMDYISNLGFRLVRAAPSSQGDTATVTPTAQAALPQPDQADAGAPAGMALIPAGSFLMGDAFGEGYSEELPVQTVGVSAFYMDTYEVTKGLWDEVATWAEAHGYDINAASGSGKASDHPVCHVSWYEAVKWANARSEKEGLTPCYTVGGIVYRSGESDYASYNWSASGCRLPTEAEWEKGARGGGDRSRFPWNSTNEIQQARANYHSTTEYIYDTSATRGYHPDYSKDPVPYTSPVGTFAPNDYGLYDMAGNLLEWCWDWYDGSYYTVSPDADPRGPVAGTHRVRRGGSWFSLAFYCRVAHRDYNSPYIEKSTLGFRLVRAAP
jgi:formylglycine-generating enzyme required for sulfatase activity